MSYEFDDDGADYRYLRNVIRSLEEEVDTIPSVAGGSAPQALISRATRSITSATPPVTSGEGEPSNWKASVHATTTGNITLSGIQTVDNVALKKGNRILVKNQTDGTTNGIYIVDSGEWERSADADSAQELENFATFVRDGEVHGEQSYLCTNSSITLGETNITIIQFASNYNDQSVEAWIRNATTDFWEGINNLQSTVQGWVETIVSGLEDAAAAVTLWYGTYVAAPWGRGDDFLDSVSRVIFGEVEEDGTEIPDPATFNFDDNETRSRTLFEWIDKVKEDFWGITDWIWNNIKELPGLEWLDGLEEGVRTWLKGAGEWWGTYIDDPWGRRDTTKFGAGFFDGIQRVVFGEVKLNGMRFDTDNNFDPTTDNTRPRNLIEWFKDIVAPTAVDLYNWIWDGLKEHPVIKPFLEWLTGTDAFMAISNWWDTAVTGPFGRGAGDWWDGINRVILGEVGKGPPDSREGAAAPPEAQRTKDNTRARTFDEWVDFHVNNFIDAIFGAGEYIYNAITVALGAAWTALTGWWDDIGGAYGRGSDPWDGIARVVFREKRKSDGKLIPIDGFVPTSENTEARSLWAALGLPEVEWPEDEDDWWDTAADTAWNNLNSNIQGGLNFLHQLFFGDLTPKAYAEGVADVKVKSAFDELGIELGIAADALGDTLANAFTAIHTWFDDTFGGGGDGALDNLQNLTQKITWDTSKSITALSQTDAGFGVNSADNFIFRVPTGKYYAFSGQNNTSYMKFYQGRIDLDNSIPSSLTSFTAGEIWRDGANVKVYSGSAIRSFSDIESLTDRKTPITWSMLTSGKTGGSDSKNNISFDNANDFYVRMSGTGSKFFVKAGTNTIFEATSSNTKIWTTQLIPASASAVFGSDSVPWFAIYGAYIEAKRWIQFTDYSAGSSGTTLRPLGNGRMWRDNNDVKVRSGGKTRNMSLIGESSGGTTNLQGITERITWNLTAGTAEPSALEVGLGADVNKNLYFNVPAEKHFEFEVGSVDLFNIEDTQVKSFKNLIPGSDGDVNMGNSGAYWNWGHFNRIIFKGSGVGTNYINVDNNNDMELYTATNADTITFNHGGSTALESTKASIKIHNNLIHGSSSASIGTSLSAFPTAWINQLIGVTTLHAKNTISMDGHKSKPATVTTSGHIWRQGNDVWVRSGNNDINISNIGGGTFTIGAGAVDTRELADDAVTNAKIARNAVDTENIASDAITSSEIDNDAVGNAHIANNAVRTDQIQNRAVTSDKISGGNNSGKFLKSTGTGTTWADPPSGGGSSILPQDATFRDVTVTRNLEHTSASAGGQFGTFKNASSQRTVLRFTSGEQDSVTLATKINNIIIALEAYGLL